MNNIRAGRSGQRGHREDSRHLWVERCLADVRREILERARLAAVDLYADGDVPKRLIGEHAIFNGFLDVAWEGFEKKPSEPAFQVRCRGIEKRTLTNLYNERPPGSPWPTDASTKPSPPPTAGRRT